MSAPAPVPLTEAQNQTVTALVRTVLGRLKTDGGVHAETAVSAAAGMAGTCLLRSFGLPIEDLDAGSPLFSEQGDAEGPELVKTMIDTLASLGVVIDPARVPAELAADHRPLLSLIQIQLTVGVPFREAIRYNGLSQREAAFACAAATAYIIRDTATVLDPHLAMSIAVRSCTQAVKTVPVAIPGGDDDTPAGQRKPWYKFW